MEAAKGRAARTRRKTLLSVLSLLVKWCATSIVVMSGRKEGKSNGGREGKRKEGREERGEREGGKKNMS